MESRTNKVHFKTFKAGKFWLVSGITLAALGGSFTISGVGVHADEINGQPVSAAKDTTPTTDVSTNKVAEATPAQQQAIDDAQKDVDQDNRDIAKNQDDTAKEQANNDDLNNQTANKRDDVNKAQDASDKANNQVNKDQDAVDDATPDGYDDVQNAKDQAETDKNKAQSDADKAQAQQAAADKAAKEAADKAAKAQADKDAAAKAKADAQAQADAAKNKADNTPKTSNVHHDPTPAKPGSQLDPTNIDSEADLPTELTEPSGLTDAEKNQDHYGSPDPWYKYTGANDTSAVIKAGTQLTAQQQKELAQYALALINSFRKQHGLKPILMSDTVQELGDAVVNLRVKDGTEAGVHSDIWSAELDDAISKVAGGNQYDVINSGENLYASILENEDTTMLQLKVQLLQYVTGMCFTDGDWNWGHRANFLSHTYGSQDEADQIYMSLNLQYYLDGGDTGLNTTTYLFDFWAAKTGTDGTAEKALSNGIYSEYVNHGYDSVETNPAYTQAVNDYNQALAQVASANKVYAQANYNANSTASASKLAQQTLANAKAQLKTTQANLANAKTKLANTEKALADATTKYGDQLNAYNAAKATLEADQAKAAQLAKDLVNAKQALANNQSAIATSDTKIKSLKDQLAQLQVKLAKDEKTLADAKAAAENNGSDTDNNGNDSNTDPDNNNSGSDDNHNNGSHADNNGSDTNNNGSDNNNSDSNNNGDDPDNNNSGSDNDHNNGSDTDNNGSDTDNNGSNDNSNTDPDNNNSGSNSDNNGDNSDTNQDANDSSSNNGGSNVNNNGSNTNRNNSDHSFNTNSELTTNDIDNSNSRSNNVTTNNLSFINSQNSSTITPAQVAAKTINQKQLPQTGDQTSNQEISLLGMIGLALSMLRPYFNFKA
ncbi:SEC10/PgrA surface exclusion domain-containing protein [Pediococcus pentosaceus]|uniref:SEC10/PgrA surface exclusion domain-containing protein n=1 Tax=Pediococcus pentosaceus TaxID=1255 RepID=UPI001303E1CB|nr:SEC10/PgrA surface exclusion domain-containing protein [Pediococcus pentosaceus]QGZ70549.1 SEC10/PgrA surface exclusion domain-containing protein [Pediococcus pentosaceus]